MTTPRRGGTPLGWVLLWVGMAAPACCAPPPTPEPAAAWQSYLDGLDALGAARWQEAASHLDRAEAGGLAREDLTLSRAVALALGEDFAAAARVLSVSTLREAQLWRYVVDQMSGTTRASGGGIQGPRSLQAQADVQPMSVSIPGHLIQGGNDYSTDFASFVFYDMASVYREARETGQTDSPAIRRAMREAGRWFANRGSARPEFAAMQYQRALRSHAARQYTQSQEVLAFVRYNHPNDADVLHLGAENWRALGRPATARREYTHALIERADFADAYVGRARVAAALGDAKRARRDVETVRALGVEPPAIAIPAAATGDPDAVWRELEAAARVDGRFEALLPIAARLHTAADRDRLRYDEWYQDRLREAADAIRARPADPTPLVATARFLIDESANRGESVEPGAGTRLYRPWRSAAQELEHAIGLADRALGRDPDHLEARVVKALAYTRLERHEEAKALVDEVMEATGFDHPEALKLYAEYKFRRAGQQQMAAYAYRMPTFTTSTSTEWRSDGLWEVTTTTRHDPSPADEAQANALVAAAAANLREAELAMKRAVELTRGTLDGYFLEADFEHWYNSRERAGQLLAEAVSKYPDSLAARDKLAWWFRWMGAYDKAVEAESNALRLVHSTAGPVLGKIWNRRPPPSVPVMTADLAGARDLDFADARISAYLGALNEYTGRTADAVAHFRAALALEETRLARDRPPIETGLPPPRPMSEFALAVELRNRLGRIAQAGGDLNQSLAWYGGNLSIENQAAPGWTATPMFGAMLPDPEAPTIPSRRPDNGANLVSRSYLDSARILRTQGKTEEAVRYFQQAASYGPPMDRRAPNIGTGRGDNNFAQYAGAAAAEAHFELARWWMEQGDPDRAQHHLGGASHQGISQDMRRELNTIQMQLARVYRDRSEREWQRQQDQQRTAYETQEAASRNLAQRQAEMQQQGAPLDPVLDGTWITPEDENQYRLPGAPSHVSLSLRADGTFAMEQHVNDSITRTAGSVTAWNGRITLTPASGPPLEGFYRVQPGMNFDPTQSSPTILQLVLEQLQLMLEQQ